MFRKVPGSHLCIALVIALLGVQPLVAGISSTDAAVSGAAGIVETSSRVTAVTVFRDRARVTRAATFPLPAGEQRVIFRGLPSVLEPETARVSGRGTTGIVIQSLELRREPEPSKQDPEATRIWTGIEALDHDRTLLQERLASLDVLRDLLTQLRGSLAAANGATPQRIDLALWGEGYGFLSNRLDAISAEKLHLAESIQKMGQEIDLRRLSLRPAAPVRRGPTFTAEIVVAAEKAGSATLALSYLSADASWSPVYDARLLPAEERLSLAAFGQIRQETGEDWSGVEVTLSSTRPLAALDLPRLASLFIRRQRPVNTLVDGVSSAISSEFIDALPIAGRNYQDVLTLGPGATDVEGDGNPNIHGARDTDVVALPSASAVPETRSAGVVYRLPGRLDIPSDGQPHRHLIVERVLPAALEYRSAPALDRSVYLVARATIPSDLTLIPGPVQHFVDDDLVGRSNLPASPGGSPLALGFGPEERLVVERREEEKRSPKGGDDVDLRRRFATTLTNQTGRPVTVLVTERLPISDDAAIRIALDSRETTGGASEDDKDRGVLRWSVTLPPAQEREVVFAYSVRSPRGLPLELAAARP